MSANLKAQIQKYLKRKLRATVSDEDSLFELGLLDSLKLLDLVAFIEKTTGAHIPDDEIMPENFETLPDIIALVQRVSNKAA